MMEHKLTGVPISGNASTVGSSPSHVSVLHMDKIAINVANEITSFRVV